jgi:hypothetical protein
LTILQERYLSKEKTQQIIKPAEVIDGLLQNIFRNKNVLDAVVSVVAFATIMTIILVFALSLRFRQQEIQNIFKIGCRDFNHCAVTPNDLQYFDGGGSPVHHGLARMPFIR